MASAHPDSPSHLGRGQWLAEELFEWSGMSCIHLRIAALFFENLELLHREDTLGDGVISQLVSRPADELDCRR